MLLLVTIDGQDWIADAGFGGSYAPPMPLVDGAEATAPDGAAVPADRATRAAGCCRATAIPAPPTGAAGRGLGRPIQLHARRGAAGRPRHVQPLDRDRAGHAFHSICVVVSIVLPHGFAALTDRDYRRRIGERGRSGDDRRPARLSPAAEHDVRDRSERRRGRAAGAVLGNVGRIGCVKCEWPRGLRRRLPRAGSLVAEVTTTFQNRAWAALRHRAVSPARSFLRHPTVDAGEHLRSF